jgi:hypothetical protein
LGLFVYFKLINLSNGARQVLETTPAVPPEINRQLKSEMLKN